MTVDHMESQNICGVKGVDRTRCGQKVNSTPGYVFEYGSPKTTCKTCLRLHALDRVKINCNKCWFSNPNNDYVCSLRRAQSYTTNNGQTVRIFYSADGLSCPDFELIGGDDL